MPVTSLLGYQTKQKVAARSGERNENVFFTNTARLFETVTETGKTVQKTMITLFPQTFAFKVGR